MPLGAKVGPGHIVLHRKPAHPQRGTAPNFQPMSIVAKGSPISVTAEHLFKDVDSQTQWSRFLDHHVYRGRLLFVTLLMTGCTMFALCAGLYKAKFVEIRHRVDFAACLVCNIRYRPICYNCSRSITFHADLLAFRQQRM